MTVEEKLDKILHSTYQYRSSLPNSINRNQIIDVKQDLLDLIKEETTKARIDELGAIDYSAAHKSRTYINGEHLKQTVAERIAQLQAELKETSDE